MRVIGTYWIGNIDVECDCGHEEHYILEEGNPFEDEGNYNDVWTCPECGKRVDVEYYVDDSVVEDLSFEELDEVEL